MRKFIFAIFVASLALAGCDTAKADEASQQQVRKEVVTDAAAGALVGGAIGWALPGGPVTAWAGAGIGAAVGTAYAVTLKPIFGPKAK